MEGEQVGTHCVAWLRVVVERETMNPLIKRILNPRIKRGVTVFGSWVMYKTLSPKWHQTFEFPDDGSSLTLHVKDHNTLLPTSSIGDCLVEYQMLHPNQMADKWIPLQGVKRGDIHIQITRKVPQLDKKSGVDSNDQSSSPTEVRHRISNQIKEMMMKLRSQVDDDDLEAVSRALSDLESLHESQEEYMVQLETEQRLLINKVNELGQEIFNSTPPLNRAATIP
ncbi:MYF24 [Orobanche gracilis]